MLENIQERSQIYQRYTCTTYRNCMDGCLIPAFSISVALLAFYILVALPALTAFFISVALPAFYILVALPALPA